MEALNDTGTLAGKARSSVPILERIGHTPLLPLQRIARNVPGVELYGKAEWLNPSGSVKDRAALAMIRAGERSGLLTRDKTIVDATSGNTGISLAMIGAALGYRVRIFMPANASIERKKVIASYGAKLVLTSSLEGTDGAQREVRKLAAEDPDRYFYPDQYNNPENWKAHFSGTANEILRDTDGRITHFVAGLGTSGTFVGTSRRLKEYRPSIRCISLIPDTPMHGIEGLKHMPTALVPGIYDPTIADDHLEVSTEESLAMARRLAREEGLFVGPSSGANVVGALWVAKQIEQGVVVTILCDDGMKYLSEEGWDPHDENTAAGLQSHSGPRREDVP